MKGERFMLEERKNIKIVKDMFAAFEKGDLKSLIDNLSDNVEWRSPVMAVPSGPIFWSKPRHNRQEVEFFFKELLDNTSPRINPVQFTAQDNRVIVEGTDRGSAKATGASYMVDWVMVMTLKKGKVTRCDHYFDTTDIVKAMNIEIRKAA